MQISLNIARAIDQFHIANYKINKTAYFVERITGLQAAKGYTFIRTLILIKNAFIYSSIEINKEKSGKFIS